MLSVTVCRRWTGGQEQDGEGVVSHLHGLPLGHLHCSFFHQGLPPRCVAMVMRSFTSPSLSSRPTTLTCCHGDDIISLPRKPMRRLLWRVGMVTEWSVSPSLSSRMTTLTCCHGDVVAMVTWSLTLDPLPSRPTTQGLLRWHVAMVMNYVCAHCHGIHETGVCIYDIVIYLYKYLRSSSFLCPTCNELWQCQWYINRVPTNVNFCWLVAHLSCWRLPLTSERIINLSHYIFE